MPDPPLAGSCACGAVCFVVPEAPLAAAYCHCRRCQKRTGTAVQASAVVRPGSVILTRGKEHLRDWTLDGSAAKSFCGLCGAHLFGRHPETGEIRAVRMSAFDADPGVRPHARQYVAYAASWEPIPDDGLPRFDEAIPSSQDWPLGAVSASKPA